MCSCETKLFPCETKHVARCFHETEPSARYVLLSRRAPVVGLVWRTVSHLPKLPRHRKETFVRCFHAKSSRARTAFMRNETFRALCLCEYRPHTRCAVSARLLQGFTASYKFNPLSNIVFTRDQQITTKKGNEVTTAPGLLGSCVSAAMLSVNPSKGFFMTQSVSGRWLRPKVKPLLGNTSLFPARPHTRNLSIRRGECNRSAQGRPCCVRILTMCPQDHVRSTYRDCDGIILCAHTHILAIRHCSGKQGL